MKRRTLPIILCVAFAVVLLASAVYVNDYYRALPEALAYLEPDPALGVEVIEGDGYYLFEPEDPACGLIFYPGGKVEYTAYAPLMEQCAEEGILCILLQVPLNLAIFDIDAAKGMQDLYPDITKWYLGGHSLGGVCAAMYLAGCSEQYDGLVLLAAYSPKNLSDTDLDVLSVYGSEDQILNMKKYTNYKENLPASLREIEINGGCHSYFGCYGLQSGDGTPVISNEEQIAKTVACIAGFTAGGV